MRRPLLAHARGFSLLEVLVTVAIFALLFAVLMAGWFQALQAQSRLSAAAQQMQQQQQLAFALRQSIAEAVSPRSGRGLPFSGDRRGFVAETSASLAPGLGAAPLPTSLRIEGESPTLSLRIEHQGQPAATYPWRLVVAELRYLDDSGRAHDSWPPVYSLMDRTTAEPPSLPTLLQFTLQFEGQARPMALLVAPRASAWQLSEPSSPFGELAD
jgi:prepilin-type N-terminal cleavage/methylation domain-containing protein